MRMNWIFAILLCFGLLLCGLGCTQQCPPRPERAHKSTVTSAKEKNLVKVCYSIADTLIENLRRPLNPEQTVLVASLVNVRDMGQSSNFGRITAEYITSRLGQQGYAVREVKLRNTLYMQEKGGEFLLSRSLHNISKRHAAQAVVVGTYAWAFDHVYVAVRMVQAADGSIISSCDTQLPLTFGLRTMMHE